MDGSPLKLVVDFGRYGNGASFCRGGWCEPELTQTRTSGSASVIDLPHPGEAGRYLLRFDVAPADGPASPPRMLAVLVNGAEVGRLAVGERASHECPVEWDLIRDQPMVSVTFAQPRAANGETAADAAVFGFSTLILLRVSDTLETPAGDAAATAEGNGRPDDSSRAADIDTEPASTQHANGYVDLYGHSDACGGWLITGSINFDPANRPKPATTGYATGAIAQFGPAAVRCERLLMAFYPRPDLPLGGIGFVTVLDGPPQAGAYLSALDLTLPGGALHLSASALARRLDALQVAQWVSQVVKDADGDPAVRSLLLRSTAGREVDEDYYLARYLDLRTFGVKATEHYLERGWREGRDPNSWFSTSDYLNLYGDVAAEGYNPLYHYVMFGKEEGRRPHARSLEWEIVAREFDACYYLKNNPDLSADHAEPIQHYLDHGWHEQRDPTPWFSTNYYLANQHSVAALGINPFLHYVMYGRAQRRKSCPTRLRPHEPLVSAIVPNYNHAEFLGERLASILEQSYRNFEIIVLDDASSDDSRAVIERYQAAYPQLIRTVYNDKNSGSVFHQWRKGTELVNGELVWICESDDSCERDFLDVLVRHFADPSIMLAFGRTQFIDAQGVEWGWLDDYRESAAAGIWDEVHVATTFEWFRGAFAIRNVIPNVGGCIFRRQSLDAAIWQEAMEYRILGDWYLYAHLAGGGRIAYDPKAVSFFRQHARNTSSQNMKQDYFWTEHMRLGKALRQRFAVPDDISFRFYRTLSDLYAEIFGEDRRDGLRKLVSFDEILGTPAEKKHILLAIYGFHTGGGEVFAIHLANQLAEMGCIVSVLCAVEHQFLDNDGVRRMLDPRIAVYEREIIDEIGVEQFLERAGIDVVHSHYSEAERLFLSRNRGQLPVPYVVTLHGSYEARHELGDHVSDAELIAYLRGVDYWVYLSKNNLEHIKEIPIEKERLIQLPNALKVDDAPFSYDRTALGVDGATVIFGIASRAVEEKGWQESIEALALARREAAVPLMLLLCGDGPELDRLEPLYRGDPSVRFLGFQPNIHGFFRLCDCCLLPTRFIGESYPLTLVQAFQVGTPAIATDLGQIGSMMVLDGRSAGVLLRSRRQKAFVRDLANAMVRMSDAAFRADQRAAAAAIGARYDMAALARQYLSIYAKAGGWRGAPAGPDEPLPAAERSARNGPAGAGPAVLG